MTDSNPIFNVIIEAKGVALEKIEPGHPGYRKASKGVITRQRDAIDLHQKLKATGDTSNGTYSFNLLDAAKTFAMLRLQEIERGIQENLDQVQTYDGSDK